MSGAQVEGLGPSVIFHFSQAEFEAIRDGKAKAGGTKSEAAEPQAETAAAKQQPATAPEAKAEGEQKN